MKKNLNIKKVIGLKGIERSGKTHILRGLANWMLKQQGSRLLCAYDNSLNKIDKITDVVDFMAVIECFGETYIIVTFGDVRRIVRMIINIIITITIHVSVKVFFTAMRSEDPNVHEEYEKILAEYGHDIHVIDKPRSFEKRCRLNKIAEEDVIWIEKLKEKM